MYTNRMRMTGLSGLDTESMINQLMRAESLSLARLKQKQALLQWKQEAYVGIKTSINTFSNTMLTMASASSIRSKSNFLGYTPTIKSGGLDSSSISVRAATSAQGGTHSLVVTSVAKKDVYVSTDAANKAMVGNAISNSSFKPGESIRVTVDGTTKEIVFDKRFFTDDPPTEGNLKIGADFNNALQAAIDTAFGKDGADSKVTVGMDAGKLTLSAGIGHTFSVSDGTKLGTKNETGVDISGAVGSDFVFSVNGGASITIGAGDFTDTDSLLAKINEELKDYKISASVNSDSELVFTNTNANSAAKITIGGTDYTMEQTSSLANLGLKNNASSSFDLNASLKELGMNGTVQFKINGQLFTFDADAVDSDGNAVVKMKDVIAEINTKAGADVKVSYDTFTNKFRMESNGMGSAAAIDWEDLSGHNFMADVFKFGAAGHTAATDAVFTLDGVTTSRDSNNFTINGITITLNQDAAGKTFDINLQKDTSAVSDLVKKFVTEYNKLVDDLNKATKTARPKSDSYNYYEPLTDEERKEMSEKDIELWEEKAKSGMLYRDDILQSIQSQMRTMLYEAVKLEDGTSISLHQIGITTSSSLSEQGKLVIDEAKLTKALEERSDDVAELFTKSSSISSSNKSQRNARLKDEGIGERLFDILTWATATDSPFNARAGIAGVSSERNSDMYKKIKAQEEKISDMMSYLIKRENHYYQMFSKLEAAMNESNSQMAALQSMLGLGAQ